MDTNGTFYFTNGAAKVTPSFNPVNVLTHDSLMWFSNKEKDSVYANFYVHGELSPRNKRVLEEVLKNQKHIDLFED